MSQESAYIQYSPNTVTDTVTISSNRGDQTVKNVTGQTGDTVQVKVPTIDGYTADIGTAKATINPDGTITTTDSVTYTTDPVQPEDTTDPTDTSTSETSTNTDPATNTVTNAPSTATAGSNSAQTSALGSGLPAAQVKTPTDPAQSTQTNESGKPGTPTSTTPTNRSGELKVADTTNRHPETETVNQTSHQGVTKPATTKTAVTTAIAPSVKNESAAGQRPSAGTADVTKTALPQTSDTTADSLVAIGVSLLVMLAGLLGFETRDPSKH